MESSKPEEKTQKNQYISNPFKLAVDATSRLFETNKVWAIVIIVLGLFGAFPQGSGSNQDSQKVTEAASSNPETSTIIATAILIFGVILVVLVIALVIGSYVEGMLSYVALQSEKGKKVTFSEAVGEVNKRFSRLLGAYALALVKIVGWSLLLIVPGIIAAVRYSLLSYVIMDQPAEEKSVKAAHDRVKEVTSGRLWEVFGIQFTGIVPIVGSLFSLAGGAALYKQLQVFTDKKLEKPKIHWLNYLALVFILIGLILLVLIGLAVTNYNS